MPLIERRRCYYFTHPNAEGVITSTNPNAEGVTTFNQSERRRYYYFHPIRTPNVLLLSPDPNAERITTFTRSERRRRLLISAQGLLQPWVAQRESIGTLKALAKLARDLVNAFSVGINGY